MLDRGLQPLVELMGSLLGARIPPADMIDLPARMTDLLARHPNIAALLMQSMHSVADAGALIAREWLDHLLDHGRRVNEASDLEGDDTALMLRQIALFNLCCGYFWAEPLVTRLTGASALSADNLAVQKRMLEQIMRAFAA